MDDLEKVETIRTKCNVNYTDAKAALDAADGNVLDAIIWLESQGKTQTTSAPRRHRVRAGRRALGRDGRRAGRLREVEQKRPTSPRRWTACGSISKSSSA